MYDLRITGDIVKPIIPIGDSSQMDFRSVSCDGLGEDGSNACRIRPFLGKPPEAPTNIPLRNYLQ
jgi:hypothetical protein